VLCIAVYDRNSNEAERPPKQGCRWDDLCFARNLLAF
jgi:hypothetical protein